MKAMTKDQDILKKRMEAVTATPDGFEFFIAIHDFVGQVEKHPLFKGLSLPAKYSQFKQIYQGIEDLALKGDHPDDLGHDRYMVIQDLLRIKKKDVSDSNSLWKKREMLRRFAADIYKMLTAPAEEKVS